MAGSFYLKQLIDKNVGPILDVRIDFPFYDNGNPKPVILVGENGTGKSTILSNIVDAFFEMAGKSFTNANQKVEQATGYQYYKAISPSEIHTGASFMYSYIKFAAQEDLKYIFKAGNISVEEVKKQIGDNSLVASWKDIENAKVTNIDETTVPKIWENNVLCYFGPGRYEKPAWMGDKYIRTEEALHLDVKGNFNGILKNPIIVHDATSANLHWLLDIIADSRADIEGRPDSMQLAPYIAPNDLFLLKQARNNLETILSRILGEEVYFQLNYRNSGGSRFRITSKATNNVICPTLDSLSTGQIALFNLFATIVRYADNNNIDHSIHLDNITGIVVIDEIDLHLHSKLQKEILPALLKLFPKIQFVITTHSPLFLLGMKDTFGEENIEVLELPTASKISTERFTEFQRAYAYLKETETYQEEAKRLTDIVKDNGKAMIITEGSTDWKHMKAAYESLKAEGKHPNVFDDLDFEFFEYEPAESKEPAAHKLKMGNSVLAPLCENMAKIPQPVKYIFIADRDCEDTNKKMAIPDKAFKEWGNNVYSFILPLPPHRVETPNICIEHYYTDDEIKTEWTNPDTGISHRLFMGNEFDKRGIANDIDRFCEKKNACGDTSIAIIEGSSGERVTCLSNDDGTNYALPKSKFAKMIMNKEAPFDSFNFDNYLLIFEIIRQIIKNEPNELEN